MTGEANRILMPVGEWEPDRKAMLPALYLMSKMKPKPQVMLLSVINVPATAPLDASQFRDIIHKTGSKLKPLAGWLSGQGFKTSVKIALARDVVEGIVEEASRPGCAAVLMQKRNKPDRVLPKGKGHPLKPLEFLVVALMSTAIFRDSTTWRVMNSLKTCPVIVTLADSEKL